MRLCYRKDKNTNVNFENANVAESCLPVTNIMIRNSANYSSGIGQHSKKSASNTVYFPE